MTTTKGGRITPIELDPSDPSMGPGDYDPSMCPWSLIAGTLFARCGWMLVE